MNASAKLQVANELLINSTVFVHFDARKAGVVVPKHLASFAHGTLQIGFNMPVPIRDLVVDLEGVRGTLSFSRTPFWCNVPWSAVFALSADAKRGLVWPDDAPPEFAEKQKAMKAEYEAEKRRAGLRLVK